MATFNHIGGAEPSTLTFKAATVSMTRNSSVMHQELISLADPESSLSVARISSLAPASSDAGLIVRQVGWSTIVSIGGPTSTAAPVSNDTGVIVRVVGYSTIVTVAAMPAGSTTVTVAALPANSSQVEVRNTVTIQGNSTVFYAPAANIIRSSIAQSSTSVQMSAANSSRLVWTCFNNPTQAANLYLKYGTTASTTDFDVRIVPFGYFEMPRPVYTGRIDGIWDSTGAGFARIAEFQP